MKEEKEKKPWTILRVRVSAIFETIAFLAILLFFDYFFGAQKHFTEVKPHPFWIIVLVISVRYGTAEGIVATALCTVALYGGYIPETRFGETLFAYRLRLALTPTLWLIASVVLGEMRMRIDYRGQRYKEMADKAKREAEEIAENYDVLKDKKERIEVKLASQMKPLASIYRSLRHLESMNPGQILLSIVEMIDEVLNPKKFSVYAFSPAGFEAMVGEGWEDKESFLRRFPPENPLFQAITARKGIVCVINEEDEAILSGEGVLATPIIDTESGEIYGMLKIEEIDFAELNISNLELAQNLAELVGTAFSNAKSYSRLERHSIYSTIQEESYSMFLYQIHKKLLGGILSEAQQDLTQIDIKVEPETGRPDKDFLAHRSSLISILNKTLSEYETIYQMGKGEIHYMVLLPLVSVEEAAQRKKQIEEEIAKDDFLSPLKVTLKEEKATKNG